MRRRKKGTLRSGSGRKVKSRKQAIAIGLSEARKKGAKVPRKRTGRKGGGRKSGGRKSGARKKSSSRWATRRFAASKARRSRGCFVRGAKPLDDRAKRTHHALISFSYQRRENVFADAVPPEVISAITAWVSGTV
jgi:hypothetical protein